MLYYIIIPYIKSLKKITIFISRPRQIWNIITNRTNVINMKACPRPLLALVTRSQEVRDE